MLKAAPLHLIIAGQHCAAHVRTYALRGLGSRCEVTTMPPKRATSMAPNATVPRMRPMLTAMGSGAYAEASPRVVDPMPSAAE